MVASMTGFGRGEAWTDSGTLLVEIRSLNHRHLEVRVRGEQASLALEERIQRTVTEAFHRGRVEVHFQADGEVLARRRVQVNVPLARQYQEELGRLAQELDVEASLGLSDLMACPGCIEVHRETADEDELWSLVEPVLDEAIESVKAARHREGQALARDMEGRVARIEGALETIRSRADQVREHHYRRLLARLKEWQVDEGLTADRLEAEVTLYAERSDITEELVRLDTHLQAFRQALTRTGPVGRRLEFILQELHREINTIGAKAKDAGAAKAVVEIKAQIDKLKEQARNIE